MGCNTSKESVRQEGKEDAKNGDIPNADQAKGKKSQKQRSGSKAEAEDQADNIGEETKEDDSEDNEHRKDESARDRQPTAENEDSVKGSDKTDEQTTETEKRSESGLEEKGSCETNLNTEETGDMSKAEYASLVKTAENVAADVTANAEQKVNEELKSIDLSDPNLNNAAKKIQAEFRRHKDRQEKATTDKK